MSIEVIKSEIEKLLSNEIDSRHSFFQLQHFIVNAEPTTQSRMWQCIRELRKRYDAMEYLTQDIEETRDNLSLMDIEIRREEIKSRECPGDGELGQLAAQESAITRKKLMRRKTNAEKALAKSEKLLQEQADEARLFAKAFEALQKIESLRDFDDPEAQREYWNAKLTRDINMSLMLGGLPINMELAKTALCMPDGAPIKNQLINIVNQLKSASKDDIQKVQGAENKKIDKE
jgi:hypothetical protein